MSGLQPPKMLPSANKQIVISAEYPNITPELLFDYFVRPSLVTRWWSSSARTHARQGGLFHFEWQDLNLHLRGQYTMVERGSRLSFSWHWDHEKVNSRPPRSVLLTFAPSHSGTLLTVMHSSYANTPAEQDERSAHSEAWCFFLTRLQQVTASATTVCYN